MCVCVDEESTEGSAGRLGWAPSAREHGADRERQQSEAKTAPDYTVVLCQNINKGEAGSLYF